MNYNKIILTKTPFVMETGSSLMTPGVSDIAVFPRV